MPEKKKAKTKTRAAFIKVSGEIVTLGNIQIKERGVGGGGVRLGIILV